MEKIDKLIKIEILNGMDGWGKNIKDNITVEEIEWEE